VPGEIPEKNRVFGDVLFNFAWVVGKIELSENAIGILDTLESSSTEGSGGC
jgi:hypothetical protein